MPRYIKLDVAIATLLVYFPPSAERQDAEDDLRSLPAADVQEVRHSEWIKDVTKRRGDGEIYDYCCSECQSEAYEGSYGNKDVFSDYCHHCGARMGRKGK